MQKGKMSGFTNTMTIIITCSFLCKFTVEVIMLSYGQLYRQNGTKLFLYIRCRFKIVFHNLFDYSSFDHSLPVPIYPLIFSVPFGQMVRIPTEKGTKG